VTGFQEFFFPCPITEAAEKRNRKEKIRVLFINLIYSAFIYAKMIIYAMRKIKPNYEK
jgi:hypothetical protein